MRQFTSSSLSSKKTISQMLAYGVVGGLEYAAAWSIISTLSLFYNLPLFVSFTLQFIVVGYVVGFLLRKYWVFKV